MRAREKESQLTPEEASELAHFLELEHILRMAKARARLILAKRGVGISLELRFHAFCAQVRFCHCKGSRLGENRQ